MLINGQDSVKTVQKNMKAGLDRPTIYISSYGLASTGIDFKARADLESILIFDKDVQNIEVI